MRTKNTPELANKKTMSDIYGIIAQKGVANTPSILSAATALASNTARGAWMIMNSGTNPLFVLLGSGASTTVFHAILKACAGQDDGSGGSVSQTSGVVYTGIITVAGTSPRYVVMEL
jgi:hypothetical protein